MSASGELPSLELRATAVPAPNSGPSTLVLAARPHAVPILIAAAGDRINLLNDQCALQQSLPFELAFPIHSELSALVEAVAFDVSTGRIAASCGGRVGIWDPMGQGWRVHSSFTVAHSVTALDFTRGLVVAGGDELTLWALDDSSALPVWTRIGWELQTSPVLAARLSPSARILASAKIGGISVRLSSIDSSPLKHANALYFRSHAWHSVRLRSVSWRPTDDLADSGPILFTTTLDGVFRLWGCMIDEPDFFSLWATLDVHSALLKHVPLATCYWRTAEMWPLAEGGEKAGTRGTKDEFVTVFSDGSVHLTTVSKFDCRPPTCLFQSTKIIHSNVFSPAQLANFRYTTLVPSLSSSTTSFALIGRCSRGTLLRADVSVDREAKTLSLPLEDLPTSIAVNFTGRIRELVPSICGDSVLALGDSERVQSWGIAADGEVVETYVSEAGIGVGAKVATWHDGRMLAVATSTSLKVYEFRHSGRLGLIHQLDVSLPCLTTFMAVRTEEESLSTTIVAVLQQGSEAVTWTYSSAQRRILFGSRQSLSSSSSSSSESPSSPSRPHRTFPVPLRPSLDASCVSLLVVDPFGTLEYWSAALPDSAYSWRKGATVRTGREGIETVAVSAEMMSAIVSTKKDGRKELSIWDPKASEFTSGQQYSQILEEGDGIVLHWSIDGKTLALATPTRVTLMCAQRLDDLSRCPTWIPYATITLEHLTAAPISTICWLSSGLAVSSGETLFFYSSTLSSGVDCHAFAAEQIAPLPLHHPQLLFQTLLHGRTDTVITVLVGLAAQLTDDGDLTPIGTPARIRMQDFLTKSGKKGANGDSTDIFSALTAVAARQRAGSRPHLTEDDARRLLSALKKCSMRGLSKLEHAHLAVVVQTVFEIQHQQGSLDANGLRYLISMRSFFIYNAASRRASRLTATTSTPTPQLSLPRIKYRDVVWAFHSECQDLLLDASIKACPDKLTWDNARALGLFLWIKSPAVLSAQLEVVGRSEYITSDANTKDPIAASLFYLALRKKHLVLTLWKQASGHPDQRSMLKFLLNDFELPRWRSAAMKNAFALLSQRRFLFAAAFFILGDSLKDAVNVCLRQLDDFPLAIAITRVYEGDDGPVLRSILEGTILPLAFENGYRWLASWAFWMLNRRDLTIQIIVTPLADLATRIPYSLPKVGIPINEDPGLVLLFAHLRSWSLQTVKGAIDIPGRTEFNFVLHMSRVLCRMGCHVLALNLVQSWAFIHPEPVARRPTRYTARHSLRRMSTKIDLDIPSNIGSRAASPERRKIGGPEFLKVLKETKMATQAPPEFNMDAFAF